ncbi:unnamed protein product [Pleuronectes platessa]|uniref:Uncharacterized protein n=1 Tax=Pleuronectes platessa TaxID=8262 RepID=A0A9N7YLD2_PLEPL|nr:unnamed protein product [Pleuronectes platessa]
MLPPTPPTHIPAGSLQTPDQKEGVKSCNSSHLETFHSAFFEKVMGASDRGRQETDTREESKRYKKQPETKKSLSTEGNANCQSYRRKVAIRNPTIFTTQALFLVFLLRPQSTEHNKQ